jgi:hypothetical protein
LLHPLLDRGIGPQRCGGQHVEPGGGRRLTGEQLIERFDDDVVDARLQCDGQHGQRSLPLVRLPLERRFFQQRQRLHRPQLQDRAARCRTDLRRSIGEGRLERLFRLGIV